MNPIIEYVGAFVFGISLGYVLLYLLGATSWVIT